MLDRKLLLVLAMATAIYAHSWVACTKYGAKPDGFNSYDAGDTDAIYYNDAICEGYPRNYDRYAGSGFANDRGYNFQSEAACNYEANGQHVGGSSAYSAQYPMATYVAGEEVCLAWPAKNHASTTQAECASRGGTATSQYIPDGGIKLFYTGPNNDMPSQAEFEQNEITPFGRGVHVEGVVDMNGFQNCPGFCENNDGAMCGGCFTVPNLSPGIYTFQWWWVFNPGSPYKTCFDAQVIGGDGTTGVQTTGAATTGAATTGAATTAAAGTTGAATTGVATTAAQIPISDDAISVARFPITVPPATTLSTFDCELNYNSAGDRMLIIDVLDATDDYAFYGKGEQRVSAGSGTITIPVTYISTENGLPPSKSGYILKAWIVDYQFYSTSDTPWAFEADKIEWPFTISEAAVGPIYPGSSSGVGTTGSMTTAPVTILTTGANSAEVSDSLEDSSSASSLVFGLFVLLAGLIIVF